jgi:hypothetical protein
MMVVKTSVHHGWLSAKFAGQKLEHHIGTGRVAKPAMDTFFIEKKRNKSFSGR